MTMPESTGAETGDGAVMLTGVVSDEPRDEDVVDVDDATGAGVNCLPTSSGNFE